MREVGADGNIDFNEISCASVINALIVDRIEVKCRCIGSLKCDVSNGIPIRSHITREYA